MSDGIDNIPLIEIPSENEYSFPEAFDNVPTEGDVNIARKQAHDDLLAYLKHRLQSDTNRLSRIKRYADVDRIISTWQRLSAEDTKRKQKQEETGKAQAVSMNMPLTHTHIDDMAAFFTEVYHPSTGAYGAASDVPESQKSMIEVINKMNDDAADTQYYIELSRTVRALLKYNVGGFHLEWEEDVAHDSSSEQAEAPARNRVCSVDMYNLLWDPSVKDVKDIRRKAEWVGSACVVNRMELIRGAQNSKYHGVEAVLKAHDNGSFMAANSSKGAFYRYPPAESHIDAVDAETATSQTVNWQAYGAGLGQDSIEIRGGFEQVTMYCWLNPAQFGLTHGQMVFAQDGFYLWKFTILAGERIIAAEPVNKESDALDKQKNLVIPYYLGYLNYDDMLGASRSTAELLNPFQSFTSFLMNAHVQGARSSIWGVKAYDSTMFDMSSLEANDGVAGYVASKQPGRDVRTGLAELKGTFDGSKTMDQVGGMLQLTQQLFPAQAMPNQIANMDRAVTSQVSALLQGVSRRLQLLVKSADEMIFSPLRFDQYRNLVEKQKVQVSNVSDGQAKKIMGSGLAQLNQEVLENGVRQIMMTMMQNQQLIQTYDITPIFNFWASLLKIPIDTSKFVLQRNPAPAPAPAVEAAAVEAGASQVGATALSQLS